MKKGHRTVFQNAWSKKNNTFIEKTILFQKNLWIHMKKGHRTVFQKCLKPKKQTLPLKNNSVPKKLKNSRLPKYHKPKKTTLLLKQQFCFKKAYKFIWKKATGPFSQMPESRETNTFIEKTILFFMLINSQERAQNRLPKCRKPKN